MVSSESLMSSVFVWVLFLMSSQRAAVFNTVEANVIANCPAGCLCIWDMYFDGIIVDCAGRGLSSFPVTLPANTVQIDASNNTIGSIQQSLPDLPLLKHLILNRNKISSLPQSLGNLPSLQVLELEGNRLGTLSAHVFRMTSNLKSLNLAANDIDTLPENMTSSLSNLQLIDLRGGNFGLLDAVPKLLDGCPKLLEIYLHDGNTKTLKAENFKNSKVLRDIFYEGIPDRVDFVGSDVMINIVPKENTLSSVQLPETVVNGGKIHLKFKSQTNLKDISGNLTNLEGATELSLSFVGLAKVSTVGDLDLGRQRQFGEIVFTGVPITYRSAVKLLSHFQNRSVSIFTFSNTKLVTNSSTDLSVFHDVNNLAVIDLSLNSLPSLDPNVFASLIWLKRLILQSTGIQSLLGARYFKNANLEILDVSGNNIPSFDFIMTLKRCPRLRELYVSHNALRHQQPIVFPAGVGSNLTVLNLDYNQLSGMLDFRNLKNLKALSLEGVYPRLQETYPTFNITLYGLGKLESLNLGQNGAKLPRPIPRPMFSGLSNLKTLVLAGNALFAVQAADLTKSFAELTALEELDLSGNGLLSLPVGVFSNLAKLNFINLADNKLLVLGVGLFKPIESLQKLNIADNVLATISKGTLPEFRTIKDMQITGNSFRCECDLRPFRDWLKASPSNHRRIIGADQLCTSPIELKKSETTVEQFTLPWVSCDGNSTIVAFLIIIPIVLVISVGIWRYCRRRGLCRRRKYLQFDDGAGTGTIRF